jgi:hypothetical protein
VFRNLISAESAEIASSKEGNSLGTIFLIRFEGETNCVGRDLNSKFSDFSLIVLDLVSISRTGRELCVIRFRPTERSTM